VANETNGTAKETNTVAVTIKFHKDNTKALEAMASAYGVNDPAIGRPLSVAQWTYAVMRQHIADTHQKRGFDATKDDSLDKRNVVTLPKGAEMWPQEVQDALRAMHTKAEREAYLDMLNAELVRAQQATVLAQVAAKMAAAKASS
jgi:hypothetical protein